MTEPSRRVRGSGGMNRRTLPSLRWPAIAATLVLGACTPASAPRTTPAPPAASTATSTPAIPLVAVQPGHSIADNLAAAPSLATLARMTKATDLAATLAAGGPYTMFAPTDAAFARLAPGNVDALMNPDNRATLAKVLSFHVVRGRLTLADLKARLRAAGGTVLLPTLEGEQIRVTMTGNVMMLNDAQGNRSYVETPDGIATNGVIHVVNGVMLPTLAN